jgi:hypothetical protein
MNSVIDPRTRPRSRRRAKLRDALTHGLHDAPAAEHGAEADGDEAAHHHPVRQVFLGGEPLAMSSSQMMPMVFCASLPP